MKTVQVDEIIRYKKMPSTNGQSLIAGIITVACILLLLLTFIPSKQTTPTRSLQSFSITATQVVMFCQDLSAKTLNDKWDYKNCVSEIQKTLNAGSSAILQ